MRFFPHKGARADSAEVVAIDVEYCLRQIPAGNRINECRRNHENINKIATASGKILFAQLLDFGSVPVVANRIFAISGRFGRFGRIRCLHGGCDAIAGEQWRGGQFSLRIQDK